MTDQRPSVLIVDDVEANLVALEAALDSTGCTLVRASSGNDALRQLLKREFAVMLLDVQMPGMDGYEVAKYARENPATREVPIIFLTAMHKTEAGVLRAYGTGAVDFLFKPVNADILRGKVRIFLELYEGKRSLASEVASHRRTLTSLEQSNEALRHFTNAASHDLRAPVRAVEGFLQALDEHVGASLDAEARDYLSRSRRAARRMDSLLRSLLTYARLQKPAALSLVKCQMVVEQVKTDLADVLQASGASVLGDDLPNITADPDRVYQVFLNVISNANKFHTPDTKPVIHVSCEQRDGFAVFCVRDNGIGVDPKDHARIFQAFQRLHSQGEYEGSGLGLVICRQIVEQHGGKIWLESVPGHGTAVYFSLPLEPKA